VLLCTLEIRLAKTSGAPGGLTLFLTFLLRLLIHPETCAWIDPPNVRRRVSPWVVENTRRSSTSPVPIDCDKLVDAVLNVPYLDNSVADC
jgi:hypothetical protein